MARKTRMGKGGVGGGRTKSGAMGAASDPEKGVMGALPKRHGDKGADIKDSCALTDSDIGARPIAGTAGGMGRGGKM